MLLDTRLSNNQVSGDKSISVEGLRDKSISELILGDKSRSEDSQLIVNCAKYLQ